MFSKAMEKFLVLNPEFSEAASILERISKRIFFKDSNNLNSYLSFIKLPIFKSLLNQDFCNSEDLKKLYEEIIKKEANGVEKMIFELLCGKKIEFDDIKLKFLFYKEFPAHIDQFVNINTTVTFEMQDLLFRKVYLHIENDDKIEEIILKSRFRNRMFYILAFSEHLRLDFIQKIVFDSRSEIKLDDQTQKNKIEEWTLGLFSLPKKKYNPIIASELLYSSFVEKMKIFRTVDDLVDHEKLSICILMECFNSITAVSKVYLVFLKLIELFKLEYGFKLKLLYSWLRYFIKINKLDLFVNLMDEIKKAKKKDDEFVFYEKIDEFLKGRISLDELKSVLDVSCEESHLSKISRSDILECISKNIEDR